MSKETNKNSKKLNTIVDAIIQDPSINKKTKVNMVIHATALICAIVAVQPLPFADIMILTPIQLVMVTALNRILGNPFEKSKLNEILTSLLGVIGWGTLAQQVILGLYKSVIPFLGGFTTIPLVYASTYALGMAAKTLIEAKKMDLTVSDEELKRRVEEAKVEAGQQADKLTVSDAIKEIDNMLGDANRYLQYKQTLKNLEKRIQKALNSELEDEMEVSELLNARKEKITFRIKERYKNLKVNDYILHAFAVCDSTTFIEKVEPVLSELNFNIHNMQYVDVRKGKKGHFLEISTEIGTVLAYRRNKVELVNVEFKEEIRKNSLLNYMSWSEEGKDRVLKDQEITQAFHEGIRQARNTVYIVSPWLKKGPYETVVDLMKQAKTEHPDIVFKVLYGIKDTSFGSMAEESIGRSKYWIAKYRTVLGSNLECCETNTHTKLVICDDEFFIIGSMNVLSFAGDYTEAEDSLHHETAIISYNKELLEELKEAYFSW